MARFDVYRFAGRVDVVLDVQADLLQSLATRLVIPLRVVRGDMVLMQRLAPVFAIAGGTYFLSTAEMAAVPASLLKEKLGNLEERRQEIIDAIDFLLQGF